METTEIVPNTVRIFFRKRGIQPIRFLDILKELGADTAELAVGFEIINQLHDLERLGLVRELNPGSEVYRAIKGI